MSFFRYPGGKRKLRHIIAERLETEIVKMPHRFEYREPFFGGGGIGLMMAKQIHLDRLWINDRDVGIACLWTAIIRCPELLKKHILEFIPSVDAFDRFSLLLKSEHPDMDNEEALAFFGFMKLAVHQLSYSGLGLKSGGPLGGRQQSSPYKIDCRWSPLYICKKIDMIHNVLMASNIHGDKCWSSDFQDVIDNQDNGMALMYVDPPYYDKGNNLYHVGFSEQDHMRLAECLRETRHRWVLSYDACPRILALYHWAKIERLSVNYSITAVGKTDEDKSSRWKYEYIITQTNS